MSLLAIYRPPSQDAMLFLRSLHNVLSDKKNSVSIIIGDFNICLNKYFHDYRSEILYDNLLEEGFLPTIDTYTRVSNYQNNSIIDQIFFKISELETFEKAYSGNIDANITDHKLQYIILKKKLFNYNVSPKLNLGRIFSLENKLKFTQILSKFHLIRDDENLTADERFEIFFNNLSDAFNEAFPLKYRKEKALQAMVQ